MGRIHTAAPVIALALGLFFAPPVAIGNLGFTSAAMAQPGPLTTKQSDALNAYNKAVGDFEQVLRQRRAQINSKQPLPNLPGQALYLARVNMISTYKDLTDALPSKIGRPNKFGIPPAYFDADGGERCSITAARPARSPQRLAIKRLGFRLLEFLDVLGRQIVRLPVAGQTDGRFG
jgi:hypothetical protein